MSVQKTFKVIPVLTTAAGSCLTVKNWQDVGVNCVSYFLTSLLMKPGFSYLQNLRQMADFIPWTEDWVLNASMPALPSGEEYHFRSPYDGAKIHCSMLDIGEMILQLKPTGAILPKGFQHLNDELWNKILETTMTYIPVGDVAQYPRDRIRGIYYGDVQTDAVVSSILMHQSEFPGVEYYVSGKLDVSLMQRLASLGVNHIESDIPANDACAGRVYGSDGVIDLLNKQYAMDFDLIDPACDCPTCTQQFTRAYLHHLLQHTPLLCQRLLIQHNVRYCQFLHLRAVEFSI